MNFSEELFDQTKTNGLPSDWKQMLQQSNFFMARREIADILHLWKQQAAGQGQEIIWRDAIGDGWNLFADNPCYETAGRFVTVLPDMFRVFAGCCPGGALHKTGLFTALNFYVGGYNLKSGSADLQDLRELSEQEYLFFPRFFKGEVIYHVSPIVFLERQWEFMVSLVSGRIIKWAASFDSPKNEFAEIAHAVFQHCERLLGSPTDEKQGWFFWDKPDGNVILQFAQGADLLDISIFATSQEIRSLRKL